MIQFADADEVEVLINMKNVSMIKLPLAQVEEMIGEDMEALMNGG